MYTDNAVFGKKQNQPYSQETQALLKKIYQDWRERKILEIKVSESYARFKAKFDESVEQVFYASFPQGEVILKEMIKNKVELAKITNEDLSKDSEHQETLKKLKQFQNAQGKEASFSTWIKNLTWKNYLFGGLGIFLIFGFLLIIWKIIFKKYFN